MSPDKTRAAKRKMTSFLSESLTVALFLGLIFGTVCFYLYSRINYTEKRLSLIENMLLDLRMSMDVGNHSEPEYVPEPVSAPSPLPSTEGEMLPTDGNGGEESLYKNILNELRPVEDVEEEAASVASSPASPVEQVTPVKVMPNYEAMLKNELVALCEKRQIKVSGAKKRADLIAALRKYDEQQSKSGSEEREITGNPHTGDLFPLAATLGDSGEGFSVDLGSAETLE
jgi:hypothetical protein